MISGNSPAKISAYTLTSALGRGNDAQLDALRSRRSGLAPVAFERVELDTYVGAVPLADVVIPKALAQYDCRNNRLAELALAQDAFADAVARAARDHGSDRIGVFVGTSTSGLHQTELAYFAGDETALPEWYEYRTTQNTFSVADYVQRRLGLEGHACVISTACSSAAKTFAAAQRAMAAGLCSAAVVGGVDTLCLTTLYGFNSLQLLAVDPCRPTDAARRGISIGEAGGLALLEPVHDAAPDDALYLLGTGESSDAHHMSAPDPDGRGALLSMQAALGDIDPQRVDGVHLHGTGTQANDSVEDRAVHALFGDHAACFSSKGWTGHTLGAAGITNVVLCLLCMMQGLQPSTLNVDTLDPGFRARYPRDNAQGRLDCMLANAFGFGGSNCSVLLGRGTQPLQRRAG